MNTVQIISVIIALLFFLQVIYYTSKNKLQDQQAFIWIILATAGLLVAIFMNTLNSLASLLGIAYMPTLIFLAAFLIILNLLIFHTTSISKHQEKIKTLSQELAFLSKEVNELKEEKNNK